MSKPDFPTLTIFITASSWIGFAVWLGFNPGALLPAFGVEDSTPRMLTEVRAFYGGVELGIGMAMILLWWRGERFASLLIGGLPLLGSASGRLAGLVLDAFSEIHLTFACLEFLGAICCLVGCWMAARHASPEARS